MKNPTCCIAALATGFLLTGLGMTGRAEPIVRPPVVRHSPPRTAVQGQALAVRAQVVPGAAPIRSVTLYGTSSRDAAPFPLPMTSAGAGAYVVTIPGAMIGEGEDFTYYIEALDTLETTGETPWFTVRLRAPTSPDTTPPLTDPEGTERRSRAGWVTPAVIAAGATLIVGGVALAVSDSGSSGSSAAGSYSGNVTRVFRTDGTSTVDAQRITIEVTKGKRVISDDLHPGTRMEGDLSGSTFVLTTSVTVDGMQGQIRYSGTVAGNQIAGSIGGEVSGAGGRSGTYSGSFTAVRQ